MEAVQLHEDAEVRGDAVALLAISDLHVRDERNRAVAESLQPRHEDDWLIVAGDVAERFETVVETLASLRSRFSRVIWTPGNHELWTTGTDPRQEVGEARYLALVAELRNLDVLTPEDPYPVWEGPAGPLVVAPLFTLYDYSFRPEGAESKEQAVALAREARVVCSDEAYLQPDPHPSREAWSRERLRQTAERLDAIDPALRTVLVSHYPLLRHPTTRLWRQEFALWCGSTATADWSRRYRAEAVVYGHLHIPVTEEIDGVRHVEASLGYPREWQRAGALERGLVELFDGGRGGRALGG